MRKYRLTSISILLIALFSVTACDKSSETAEDAKDAAGSLLDSAKDSVSNSVDAVKDGVNERCCC